MCYNLISDRSPKLESLMQKAFTILLVEDDIQDALLVQQALKEGAIRNPVQVVRNGQEAIDYLEGKGPYADRRGYPIPRIAVCDINMPKVNGFELLRWLRSESDVRRLPVVMMSSSNRVEDINRAYDLGVNAYLVKPRNFDEMVDVLNKLVQFWSVTLVNP
jgi:CheY-like chemotaxis protein